MPHSAALDVPLTAAPAPAAAAAASDAAPETFADWKAEVRTAPRTDEPRPRGHWRRMVWRSLVCAAVLGGTAAGVIGGWRVAFPPTATVRGTLLDPAGRPVMGARVFAASNPRLETATSLSGRFELRGLRLGRQAVVAVLEDLGEEYVIEGLERDEARDLGELRYRVPLLVVRLTRGAAPAAARHAE